MPVSLRVACLFLALSLLATGQPALAQDAPPHEGEGVRRPAPAGKAAQPKGKAVAPAKAAAASKSAPAVKPAQKSAQKDSKKDAKPPLRSLDKNHDGRVTREEYLAGSKKRFAKADANRDGVVSPQEGKAAKAALAEKQARRDAKRQAEGKPVKRKKTAGASSKPYLSSLDKNKDGRVSQKEYLARREKKFAEMDVNRDGSVSREEARSAKKKAQERREEKKAQAKARRLRKIEEARQAAMSSPGPEFVGTVTPPSAPPVSKNPAGVADTPAVHPAAPGTPAPQDMPLTPIAPGLPAQAEPET